MITNCEFCGKAMIVADATSDANNANPGEGAICSKCLASCAVTRKVLGEQTDGKA